MNTVTSNSGPFGTARRGTVNHVLNALNQFGVPLGISQNCGIGGENITLNNQVIARYRYFDSIDQPLFFIKDKYYMKHPVVSVPETNEVKTVFRLTLSPNSEYPWLSISGHQATSELRRFIMLMCHPSSDDDFSCELLDEPHEMFNGLDHSDIPIIVEFRNSKSAQAFVDYLNENYKVKSEHGQQQVIDKVSFAKERLLEQVTKLIYQYEEETDLVAGAVLCLDASKETEYLEWNGERFLERNAKMTFENVDKKT